jgi:glycosyltransferase involved in cell wall biosynthesis
MTGHCTHFEYIGCDKWEISCDKCPQKHEYPTSYVLDQSTKNYRTKQALIYGLPTMQIVTVSEWLKEKVSHSFFCRHPIMRIYNGIDIDAFKPCENNIKKELHAEDKKLILLVSDGWDRRKGYEMAIAVAKNAPSDWHFVMIGLSRQQVNNLPSNMTGLERIWNQQELIEYYSAADVFFNPAVEETFGLVTVEAMACGTPVVVMNSTACPELIVTNECGTVLEVNAKMPEILTVIEETMNKNGAREAAVSFSLEKSIEEYMKIYYKIDRLQ